MGVTPHPEEKGTHDSKCAFWAALGAAVHSSKWPLSRARAPVPQFSFAWLLIVMSRSRALGSRLGHRLQSAVSCTHKAVVIPPVPLLCSHWVASSSPESFIWQMGSRTKQFSYEGGQVGNWARGRWQSLSIILHPTGHFCCQQFGLQLQSYFCTSEYWWVGLRWQVLNNVHHKEYSQVSAHSVLLLTSQGHDESIWVFTMISGQRNSLSPP